MRKFLVRVNGEEFEVEVAEIPSSEGKSGFQVQHIKPAAATDEKPSAPLQVTTTLRAPMPGRILALSVEKGDQVKAGQVVLVLEAMKMENEIQAENAGTVTQVLVAENDVVDTGDPLLEIEEKSQ